MTDERGGAADDGLAPVTDLFGGTSRRRRGAGGTDAGDTDAGGADGDRADVGGAGADDGDAGTDAGSTGSDGWWEPGAAEADADAPVPLGRSLAAVPADADAEPGAGAADAGSATGARGRSAGDVSGIAPEGDASDSAWRSPVVGDARERRVPDDRVEPVVNSDTADARRASVFAISSGEEIDPEDAPRSFDDQAADAELISMRALGRKGTSEHEMRLALGRQDLDEQVIEAEIERLTRVGLLDDHALATELVDRLHDRKGLGRQGVVSELRKRGIAPAAIEAALDAATDDGDDEFARAIELAEKRARQMRGLDQATAERRLSGFLMRKGYGSGVVRIAVERALGGGPRRPSGGGGVRFE